MPNAPTHDKLTVVTVAAANVAYFKLVETSDWKAATIFSIAYLFAGYACAGDLDLKSKEYRRWGIFRFIWLPYQWAVPHRSFISHGLVIGGIIRALYLAFVCTLICWLCIWGYSRLGFHVDPSQVTEKGWRYILDWVQANQMPTAAFFLGFVLAGTTHSLADYIYSAWKRQF